VTSAAGSSKVVQARAADALSKPAFVLTLIGQNEDPSGKVRPAPREVPAVTFVHVTVPLTIVQTGAKAWLKRRLGKAPWGEQENVVRHRFNSADALIEFLAKVP